MKWHHSLAVTVLLLVTCPLARAELTITATETSTGVSLTGSGSLNLLGLSPDFSGHGILTGMTSDVSGVRVGPPHDIFSGPEYNLYVGDSITLPDGMSPPPSFPVDHNFPGPLPTFTTADGGSGDLFGVGFLYYVSDDILKPLFPFLAVPASYTSGAELFGTAFFSGHTFDSLGITPGNYVWTWGTDATHDSLTLRIVPEPSALLIAIAAAIRLLLRRRMASVGGSLSV